MTYWGKVVGTIAGLATGRPWIGLLGFILGHQFDRGFADKFTKFGPEVSQSRLGQVSPRFAEILFETMGHVAKADGRVTEDEIRAARALMHRLGMGPAEIRSSIRQFEAGKRHDYPLRNKMRELREQTGRKQDARGLFLRLLMEVVLASGTVHQSERLILWTVCKELDVGRAELAQLEAMLRAQRGFRRSAAGDADTRRIDLAYRTLGVEQSSSNDDIKKAYRRLMNKSHPDKLAGGDHDAAVISEAERRTREVRGAYELLKTRRSIR
jgi:DnaJ like chaperone protein